MIESVRDLGTLKRVDALTQTLGTPCAGLEIIDVGSGEGELARALARLGASVSGIDPFIDGCDWLPEGAGRFRLVRASADTIPLEDDSVDLAIFMFSLHHVPGAKLASALADVRRVLRPSGALYVAEPLAQGPAQYVMELFHDETAVRAGAQSALRSAADPYFAQRRTYLYREPRTYAAFDEYAQRMIDNIRFNTDYAREDVLAPAVRSRFDEMMRAHDGRFDQPVRVDLFREKRPA